jgi:hypothetical protein
MAERLRGKVMALFLTAIVVAGVMLILGLAFNVIRPGRQYWHEFDPDDEEFQTRHNPSWRDSH